MRIWPRAAALFTFGLLSLAISGHASETELRPDDLLAPGWRGAPTTDGCIPKRYWRPSLLRLKPGSVCRDHGNLVVTTDSEHGCDTGLYIVLPESSFLPTDAPGRTFKRNGPQGALQFRFCRRPAVEGR